MTITVNGEKQKLHGITNVSELVSHYRLQDKLVVVEIDGTVIERENWEETQLRDGMTIELVHFVGGG